MYNWRCFSILLFVNGGGVLCCEGFDLRISDAVV